MEGGVDMGQQVILGRRFTSLPNLVSVPKASSFQEQYKKYTLLYVHKYVPTNMKVNYITPYQTYVFSIIIIISSYTFFFLRLHFSFQATYIYILYIFKY